MVRRKTRCVEETGREFTLELQVEDSFMESNNKKVQLHIKDKEVKLVSGQRADVILKTNIADLSSLVIGAIPLAAFLWTGRMQCSDTAYAPVSYTHLDVYKRQASRSR